MDVTDFTNEEIEATIRQRIAQAARCNSEKLPYRRLNLDLALKWQIALEDQRGVDFVELPSPKKSWRPSSSALLGFQVGILVTSLSYWIF